MKLAALRLTFIDARSPDLQYLVVPRIGMRLRIIIIVLSIYTYHTLVCIVLTVQYTALPIQSKIGKTRGLWWCVSEVFTLSFMHLYDRIFLTELTAYRTKPLN